MAGLLDFFAGVTGEQVRRNDEKRQDRREMKMAERKAMLNLKLEEDLMRRKAELAKQYPTYAQFIKTPLGDVIGFSTAGDSKVVREAPPEEKALLRGAAEALTGKRVQDAEAQQALVDYRKAQTDLSRDRMANPARYRNPPAAKKDPNSLTASQADMAYVRWLKLGEPVIDPRTGKQAVDIMTGKPVRKPLEDTPENRQRWQQSAQSRGIQGPGILGGMVPQQAGPAAQEEDDDPISQLEALINEQDSEDEDDYGL